ncbi:hypothetical protein C440_07437 [Haloferax mucosum ATCC BAA-1512]|uniref:Uncharacterized protein n=1 Tax=Haloferax mucosum ATCC BAA-1512 TaxID=662479 RepID=M0IDN3_9EURY|nr:hypothetical protein [Haloferax mucosum]ELZ94890.1 hypothetical protein C440_07437 [Haloferax mucosum ATCC BAA-1512]
MHAFLPLTNAESLSQRLCDPTAWVETRATSLVWVHPHYRWACGLDERRDATSQ